MDHLKYRTGPRRILATIADRVLFFPLLWMEQWLYYEQFPIPWLFSWLVMTAILRFVFAVILHNRYGYTPGKWLMGLQVLDLTESRRLTIKESFRRESVYFLIEVTGIFTFFYILVNTGDPGNLYERYRNLVRNVGLIWVWLILVSMLSNAKRRSIQDFLGGSVVVRS